MGRWTIPSPVEMADAFDGSDAISPPWPNHRTLCAPCSRAPSLSRTQLSQARLSGKREGVPGLERAQLRVPLCGVPVIWRRRDAQTLRPAGNGRIVDRLDIDGVAL